MSEPLDNLVQRIKSGKTRRESQPSKAALLGGKGRSEEGPQAGRASPAGRLERARSGR